LAQASFDNALRYALERKQFGKPLYEFPRVSDSIVLMATETLAARQLTYHAAYMKDSGQRRDYDAGMAKLLGARVAMACADNALQIHGGMGFAQETRISGIWCDARVLSIFEGAAEIQANIIGKALLDNPSLMARTGGQKAAPPEARPN
jgi:(2S)-methylsuccinyl-CoA dehydrogenase